MSATSTAGDIANKPLAATACQRTVESYLASSQLKSQAFSVVLPSELSAMRSHQHVSFKGGLGDSDTVDLVIHSVKNPYLPKALIKTQTVQPKTTVLVPEALGDKTFYEAINRAVNKGSSRYIAILSTAVSFENSEGLSEMIGLLRSFPETATVGLSLLSRSITIEDPIEFVRSLGAYRNLEISGYGGAPSLSTLNPKRTFGFETRQVLANSIVAIAFRRTDFKEFSEFDTRSHPRRFGDLDFCLRMSQKGRDHVSLGIGFGRHAGLDDPQRFGWGYGDESSIMLRHGNLIARNRAFPLAYDFAYRSNQILDMVKKSPESRILWQD